ncbi:glycosyltransferase family 2 protein [Hyunsoonleella aestuarii]|uniref:Glycosyltransferase family 2 protein n=1 Tax=Hyunsoonleella aestuarii TaxID=912802 RepID=A0ABP8E7J7_9FLAO|nr:glycosyltransferase family 2 protein [Hyunsoonleella aestuarii]
MNTPKVFVVIASYNGVSWIKDCLDSLNLSEVPVFTIVVDNNSSDTTVDVIETNFPNVTILKQNENLGFGKANNLGISHALKLGADYVLLLNQDAKIRPSTIKSLINAGKNYQEYGVLSPIHLNWDGNNLEHYFSKFALNNPNFYSDFVLEKKLKSVYEAPFVNAACWLLKRNILEVVGGFDPVFFHYGEDNNYCQRVQYHGFKIGIVPNCFIEHDSVVRYTKPEELFTRNYYRDALNKLKINLCDINKVINKSDYNGVRKHIFRLILINLFKFNFKNVIGYFKKYVYFNKAIASIEHSRNTTITKHPHYLDS